MPLVTSGAHFADLAVVDLKDLAILCHSVEGMLLSELRRKISIVINTELSDAA